MAFFRNGKTIRGFGVVLSAHWRDNWHNFVIVSFVLPNVAVQIQAACILSIWVMVTGGLHLDGLADCAEAWVGGIGSKQRSLKIMKDPAAGPMAVIVLVLTLQLKWAAIVAILE